MEIKAYVYVQKNNMTTMCFKCAVKEIITGTPDDYDLALEIGKTGGGNDMRSIPMCAVCGESFQDYSIA
jgi:hypothetical protein